MGKAQYPPQGATDASTTPHANVHLMATISQARTHQEKRHRSQPARLYVPVRLIPSDRQA